MKTKLSYILYCIALILVCAPMILEQTGNPLTEPVETIVLIIGLVVLIIGKLISAFKRRKAGESSYFHDGIIVICLIGVAAYLVYTALQ